MNWIRNHLAASVLIIVVSLTVVLFATGKLRWSSSGVSIPAEPNTKDSNKGLSEAAEKKVKHGRVILDLEDYKASGISSSPVQPGSVGVTLEAPGEVQPAQTRLSQVTPPIAGIVRAIHKVTGDPVSAGTALCTIESADLSSVRAELQNAQAEQQVTQRIYERSKELYERGLRSQTELWAAEAEFNKSRLRVEAASVRLRALGFSGTGDATLSNRYELRSPLSGVVLQQQLTVGQSVETKDVLYTVADLSTVWVNASLHEQDLRTLRSGMTVGVQLRSEAAAPILVDGTVEYVGQQADPQSRTVPVRISVKNRSRRSGQQGFVLKPGAFVTVRFITAHKSDVLTVPLDAIQELEGQNIVFVESDGTESDPVTPHNENGGEKNKNRTGDSSKPLVFEPRAVTLGISDGKATEIVKGLRAGERVVVHNAYLLKSELEKEKIGDTD